MSCTNLTLIKPMCTGEFLSLFERCVPAMIINPRDTYATITFVNDLTTLQAVTNVTEATLASVKDRVSNLDFIIFFVPTPKIIQTYAAATGGNVLGLADRNKDLIG